jgi:hypothetical protein
MPKSEKTLTDKNWFKTAQGILTLAGGAVGLLIALISLWPKPQVEPSKQYAEILLDSSEGMREAFDGTTKMDAARNEITGLFRSDIATRDGLALRRFGGPCGPKDTELLLDFDKATADAINNAALKLMPSGQNSLVHGITEGTSDFSRIGHDNPKRIIVITGGGNPCPDDIQELRTRVEMFKKVGGTTLDLHYIGLGLTPGDQEKLSQIAKQSGGEIKYVNTHKELEQVLHQIVIVEPVITDARKIIDILNDTVNQLNTVLLSVNSKDYADAESGLNKAREVWHKSDASFAALKTRSGEDFQHLFQDAKQQRDLQLQMLSKIGDVIQYAKSSNAEEFNKAAAEYRDLADRYNGIIKKSDELLRKLGEHRS